METAVQRNRLLMEALHTTEEMASLGDAGDWRAVVEKEIQRRALLEQAFAGNRKPADEQMAATINAILALDKQLMRQGQVARSEVAAELGKMNKGRKGAKAYRDMGR